MKCSNALWTSVVQNKHQQLVSCSQLSSVIYKLQSYTLDRTKLKINIQSINPATKVGVCKQSLI